MAPSVANVVKVFTYYLRLKSLVLLCFCFGISWERLGAFDWIEGAVRPIVTKSYIEQRTPPRPISPTITMTYNSIILHNLFAVI